MRTAKHDGWGWSRGDDVCARLAYQDAVEDEYGDPLYWYDHRHPTKLGSARECPVCGDQRRK